MDSIDSIGNRTLIPFDWLPLAKLVKQIFFKYVITNDEKIVKDPAILLVSSTE